jgi:hypothetical protein
MLMKRMNTLQMLDEMFCRILSPLDLYCNLTLVCIFLSGWTIFWWEWIWNHSLLLYWCLSLCLFYIGCSDIQCICYNYIFLMNCSHMQYTLVFFVSSELTLQSLSDISTAASTCFGIQFAWNMICLLFTFSLYLSLLVRWVSTRQHIVGSCFIFKSIQTMCIFQLDH